MTAEKTIRGYWVISDVINGYLEKRIFIGYTKREAVREFKNEFKTK